MAKNKAGAASGGEATSLADVLSAELPVGSEVNLGNDLWLVRVRYDELREQDLNAHVMPKAKFERLVENIRMRGAPESVPYCYQPPRSDGGKSQIEIVSGHHRVRACRAAGMLDGWVLVDRAEMSRSQVVARQLAHNAIVGYDDNELVRELLKMIDTPEDMLLSGVDQSLLPSAEHQSINLFMPRIDFEWKTVSFSFLSHQLEDFERLIEALDGRQDLVAVAPLEAFKPFVLAAAAYARIKKILSGSMAVAMLTQIALREVEAEGEEVDGGEVAEAADE